MVAMDVAAEKATELPRLGSARMKLSVQASQTEKERSSTSAVSGQQSRGRRTCADRGAPAAVDFVEEARAGDRAVAAEGIHHA